MSIENSPHNRPEDFESAQKLIEENELLRNDPATEQAMKMGIGLNGEPIKDIGEFLASRIDHLEEESSRIAASGKKNRDVFVRNSDKPELEDK